LSPQVQRVAQGTAGASLERKPAGQFVERLKKIAIASDFVAVKS